MSEEIKRHLETLAGLIDGEITDDLGNLLSPIHDLLVDLTEGNLCVVCSDDEEGLIPVGIAMSIKGAMVVADNLACRVTVERVESERAIEIVPTIRKLRVVECESFL